MFTYYQFFHVRAEDGHVFGPSHSCDSIGSMQRLVAEHYPEGLEGRYVIQRITIDPHAAFQSAECREVGESGEPVMENDLTEIDKAVYASFEGKGSE